MEETIGYEALFSPEEWDEIMSGEWSISPEGEFPEIERKEPPRHRVTVIIIDDGYELTCDSCEFSDHVSDVVDADNLKRLHEEFLAVLVDRYEVTS